MLVSPPIEPVGSVLEPAAETVCKSGDSQLHHPQDTVLPATLHHLIGDLWVRLRQQRGSDGANNQPGQVVSTVVNLCSPQLRSWTTKVASHLEQGLLKTTVARGMGAQLERLGEDYCHLHNFKFSLS